MEEKDPVKKGIAVPSGAQDIFDWWNAKASIKKEDSLQTKLKKILIRILGIIILIIFSPILLVIFLFVFAIAL